MLQTGALDGAALLLERVLSVVPDHPDAVHYAGVLAQQRGRTAEAIALIERSLALRPTHADWWSNLGIALRSDARVDAAADAFRRAIALDPGHANAHSNLGVVLRASGKADDAERAYRTALAHQPGHVEAWTNLGVLLNGRGRAQEAAACFSRALTLRPRHPDTRRLLALAHCTLGEIDEATRILREWLDEVPGHPVATHMLAACGGGEIPARASDRFVTETFDAFAATFEAKLARLAYRAPSLIGAALEDAGLVAGAALDVLDAGCGTGLCGPIVAPYARRLVGVDLSAGMLAHARAKGLYHDLVQDELTAFLGRLARDFDLIVCADALVYFGRLDEVATGAARALRPNGRFVFTVERLDDAHGADFRLELHGRYSHSRGYVEQRFLAQGFRVEMQDAELRMESGVPVAGLVVLASLPGGGRDVAAGA
jgi:predicted TPR repeat methyltransferase